ncbi:MAG: hypothetical protein ACLFVY_05330 [Phycisphaerae bacterium]
MKHATIALIAAAMLAGLVAPAAADDVEKKDRQVYNTLIKEIRASYRKLASAYDKAVAEAREGDGQASTRTRAEILGLKDTIDMKSVRLMLVADRHGWEVPSFSIEDFKGTRPAPKLSAVDQLLPGDPMVTEALNGEAAKLASGIQLPLISITAGSGASDDRR